MSEQSNIQNEEEIIKRMQRKPTKKLTEEEMALVEKAAEEIEKRLQMEKQLSSMSAQQKIQPQMTDFTPPPPPPPVQQPMQQPVQYQPIRTSNPVVDIIASKIAEKRGVDKDTVKVILEDILEEDKEIFDRIEKFGRISSLLGRGTISSRVADIESGKMLRTAGEKLMSKLDREGDLTINDLLKLFLVKMIMDTEKKDQQTQLQNVVVRMPLYDPATGQIIRDEKGNPIFTEYVAPPYMVPMFYMGMNQNRKQESENNKLVESLLEELKEYRKTIDNLLEKVREEREKSRLEKLESKIEALMQSLSGKNTVGSEASPFQNLKAIKSLMEEARDVLESLGWRVEKPTEAMKGTRLEDIEKIKVQTDAEIKKEIGKAVAEILKNPEKLDRWLSIGKGFIEAITSMSGGAKAEKTEEVPRMEVKVPRLEDYLKKEEKGNEGGEG